MHIQRSLVKTQNIYLLLLSLLSLGCFNEFALNPTNPLFKLYGLMVCLNGGIALLYFAYRRDRRKEKTSKLAR